MADEEDPQAPADDAGTTLRKQAAARLLAYSQKQVQLAQSLFASFATHSSASTSLLATAVETGKFQPELWWSNAVALSIEAFGSSVDACLGGATPSIEIDAKSVAATITFDKDAVAEVAGPSPLQGVPATDFTSLGVSALTAAGGGAVTNGAVLKLTTDGSLVYVEIRGLTLGGGLPPGFYTGLVTKTAGTTTTQVGLVVLRRS